MKTCVICGAGEYDGSPILPGADLYIAADAGLDALLAAGLRPDLLIGDFDSLSHALPADVPTVRLPVEKDVTDADAAAAAGLERGCGIFHFYGVLGGRPDHSLANLSLLARLTKRGALATLYGAGYTVTAVADGALDLPARESGGVSVFSFTDKSEGVTIRGLRYGLENGALTSDFALGVSNSFIGLPARIEVKKGLLIVMTENP